MIAFRLSVVSAAVLFAATPVSARADGIEDGVVFERDVLPIFNSHCLSCHGGLHQKGKLDLRSIAAIKAGGKSGPSVEPGKRDASLLWQRMASDEMPPKAIKVSPEQKRIVARWIESGAKSASQNLAAAVPERARSVADLTALIDREIDARLARAKIPASPPADDGEFLRRAYLDFHGRIPTASQAREFHESSRPDKRAALIDALLADASFGHYGARQWRDRVAVPVVAGGDLGSSHTQAFHKWLAEGLNANRPWDQLVREMIVAEGDAAPGAFIRQCMDDGQPRAGKLAASTARRFLGVQMQCAECHDHPFTSWKQDDFWGLAAFYSRTTRLEKTRTETRVGIFDTEEGPKKTRFGLKPLERKAGGAVLIPDDAGPHARKEVPAKFLQGEGVPLDPKASPRTVLADWVVSPKNPYFSRAAVNRVWAQMFGRGLVEPVDSLDAENVPTHPSLLNDLAGEFAASGFEIKRLVKAIALSRAYQRTHRPTPGNESDATLYSHAIIRAVPPESYYDCLVIASGAVVKNGSQAEIAAGGKRGKSEILSSRGEFLKLFATADIDGDPSEYTHGIPQVLALLNERATNEPCKLVQEAVGQKGDDDAIVSRIYLGVLSRMPTNEEVSTLRQFLGRRAGDPTRYQAVWWALVNSAEFAMIP